MENTEACRTERIAAGLEKQFQSCHDKLAWAMDRFEKNEQFTSYEVKYATTMMKTCAQLANVILRLDAQSARDVKNRGSNPQ